MISIQGVYGKVFVLDLVNDNEGTYIIRGNDSIELEEGICTIEELRYILNGIETKRINVSNIDKQIIIDLIDIKDDSGGSGGIDPSILNNKEDKSNKIIEINASNEGSISLYPSVKAVKDLLDSTSSGGGVALGETSSTAYRGDRGKVAYDHSQSQGNPHNTTTSEINEGTKLFFTEPRVRQTVLTGLDTSTASPALATDQLLAAIGKLQAQINNMGGGDSVTWVNAASIGTTHASFVNVQFAKINGLLWIRGYCSNAALIGAGTTLFSLTDPSYHLDIPSATVSPIVLGEIKTFRSEWVGSKLIELKNVVNNANKFSLHNSNIFIANEYNQIQPVALGRLLTP